MHSNTTSPSPISTTRGRLAGILLLLGLGLFLAGALSVPFVYETQTLWYKTGMARHLLRMGQLAGLMALVLLLTQILLALKPPALTRLFKPATLLRWHKLNGGGIAGFALTHVTLVLAPEGWRNLPLGMKYWPEMAGGLLLLTLLSTVLLSFFRAQLGVGYPQWKRLHRFLGFLLLGLIAPHVLFVSESFAQPLPRTLLLLGLGMIILLIVSTRRRQRRNP